MQRRQVGYPPERACYGKYRYSLDVAEKLAQEALIWEDVLLSVYPCGECWAYHLGHMPFSTSRNQRREGKR